MFWNQKILRFSGTLITSGILTFGFVCMGMLSKIPMNMSIADRDSMPLLHEQPCCNVGISHTIDLWKNIVLGAPDKTRDILMLFALGLTLAFGYSLFLLRYRPHLPDPDTVRVRLYMRENPNLLLFDHLKLAFARGILNPKIYR